MRGREGGREGGREEDYVIKYEKYINYSKIVFLLFQWMGGDIHSLALNEQVTFKRGGGRAKKTATGIYYCQG